MIISSIGLLRRKCEKSSPYNHHARTEAKQGVIKLICGKSKIKKCGSKGHMTLKLKKCLLSVEDRDDQSQWRVSDGTTRNIIAQTRDKDWKDLTDNVSDLTIVLENSAVQLFVEDEEISSRDEEILKLSENRLNDSVNPCDDLCNYNDPEFEGNFNKLKCENYGQNCQQREGFCHTEEKQHACVEFIPEDDDDSESLPDLSGLVSIDDESPPYLSGLASTR